MAFRLKIKSLSLLSTAAKSLMVVGILSGMTALSAADLKPRIKVQDVMVRLSDIFTDIALEADKDVFAAPLPGQSKQISTTELWKVAQQNNIDWQRPAVNHRVRIMREGQPVDLTTLKEILGEEVKARGVGDDVQVSVFGMNKNLYLPVNSDILEIEITSLTMSTNQNRYRAQLQWPLGEGSFKEITLNGAIEHVRLIPVLNRTMVPGEIVAKSDINWINMSVRKITRNSIQTAENFIGFTPRRAIAANKMLRTSDLEALKSVKKGNQVTITYISGPMVLKTVGKALQNGAMGEPIRILNMKSNKVIIAQVSGIDQVEILSRSTVRQLASR